jgi:hypothetical protein
MKTTVWFAAAAAVSLGLAWAVRPTTIRSESEEAIDKRNKPIFADLDAEKASSLKIVKFDEELAALSRLEIAKDSESQVWKLPSADGYPADSAEQVSQATAPMADLIVLSTVSSDRGDHALYGVVEPKDDMNVSASGVGTLIQVGGSKNEILASLVVGKEVDGVKGQYYVRVPSEDAVYVVEFKKDVYSTQFDKWIKGEILSVRSMDIEAVGLRDYAILPLESGGFGLGRNFDADLVFKDNKWSQSKFVDHKQQGSPTVDQIPEGKTLNETALNDLRNSVQNLKIVDVKRKPPGLAADLKADKSLLENKESTKSLQSQGFFPMEGGEVYAAGGELIVGSKDGVRYLLRFGNVRSAALAQSDEDKKEGEETSSMRRYLLVNAQLDESKFPPPDLKVVPETVEEMLAQEAAQKAAAEPETTTTPKENIPGSAPAKDDSKSEPDNTKPGKPDSDQPKTDNPPSATDKPSTEPSTSEPETKKDEPEAKKAGDPPSFEASDFEPAAEDLDTCEAQESEATKAESAKDDTSSVAPAQTELKPSRQETAEELKERLQFLQETIRKENQRLIDKRNDSLKEARKKVLELNAKFADWYYIVSEDVYAKMRISRDQLYKSADPAPSGGLPTAPGLQGGLPGGLPGGFQLPNGN